MKLVLLYGGGRHEVVVCCRGWVDSEAGVAVWGG